MWDIVRRFMKMGMLKLEKQTRQPSDKPPIDENEQKSHRESQPRPPMEPKLTGFAARREQVMADSTSK
jgi:hypothetical protein